MLNNAGVWFGILLAAYSIMLILESRSFDYYNMLGPGPGFFPMWMGGIMLLVTLIYLWESIRDIPVTLAEILPQGDVRRDILMMLGGLCVFALTVERVGFVVSGSVLVFAMTMRSYKWYFALPSSIAVSFAVSFIFQIMLGVPLPTNEYGW